MRKAVIIYSSRTGITGRYGRQIGHFISSNGIETKVHSVDGYGLNKDDLDSEIVILGCWTAGFMLLFQHPDRKWKRMTRNLPDLKNRKVAFFTTYKIATGSMFRNMQKQVSGKQPVISLTLKSKNGCLTDADKKALTEFIS
jgi:flavodoxin